MYDRTDPKQITRDRFIEMLEILPPSRWHRGNRLEFFHVCERLTGNLVMWFVRLDDTYWEFNDEDTLSREDIRMKMQKAVTQ